MPKIGRIRIANVNYSGKYIVDQMIDSYQGQNILLNLANGGGKSVLTQLMMQVVLPTVKIHKRNMESYLVSNEPTFVMIEWILDNTSTPTYFLTGIVMNKTITEENSFRIKYFTFVNEYKSANSFDIKNIDFISNNNGITTYKSYDYCLKKLREQEAKNVKIVTYSRDERKEYNEKLEENGIFKNEWKILARINEKEGGIDDLFEKCETSDDVINQWILKNISDNLENGDKLREMFADLIEDIMENEETIKQKEELDNFKIDAERYIKSLSELLENIDEEEKLKTEIEDIYLKLQLHENEKQNQILGLSQNGEELKKELENIEYEILSQDYYKVESDLENSLEVLEESRSILDKKIKMYNEKNKELRMISASKINDELKKVKAKLEAVYLEQKNLKNGIDEDEIRNLEYSLKIKYNELSNEIKVDLLELESKLEKIKIEQKNIENSQNNNIEENKRMTASLAVIETKIDEFKVNEQKINKELGINLLRNILEEIDEKDVQKIIQKYESIENDIKKDIQEADLEIKTIEKKYNENDEEIYKLEQRIEDLLNSNSNFLNELKIYNNKEDDVLKSLESIALAKERLFDRENNLIEIERQISNVKARNDENIINLNKNKDLLDNLKSGEFHIETDFRTILDKNKIQYETGENYIKEQPIEFQKKLLNKNPMLPYSYIIAKKSDFEKISELTVNCNFTRIVPIILHEDIENDFNSKNKFIDVESKIKIACLYNNNIFDEEQKENLELEVSNQIEELVKKTKEDAEKIFKLENIKNIISEFDYKKDYKLNLQDKINNLKEEIDNSKNEKELKKLENKKIISDKEILKEKITDLEKLKNQNDDRKIKFNEYLKQNFIYMENITQKNNFESKIKKLEKQNREFKEKIEETNKIKQNLQENIRLKNSKLREIGENKIHFEKAKESKVLEKSLEELEKMYQVIKEKITGDEKKIEERIIELTEAKEKNEKELKRNYSDLDNQYESLEYTEEQEDVVKDELEDLTKEKDYADQDYQNANLKKVKLEAKFENAKSNLAKINKIEPIHASLIKGNFEYRKKDFKEKIKNIDIQINELKKKIIKINENKNSVLRYIEKPQNRKVNIIEFNYDDMDISKIAKQYKDIQNKNREEKMKLNNIYTEISRKNESKNQVIINFLRNMNPYQNENEFADYYFIFERVTECASTLEKILKALNTSIENMEKDKENVKYHAYTQGKNIYLEMKKISDDSTIKMPGKLRKVSLMEIEIPKELDSNSEDRINEYIEQCINNLREECRGQENIREIVQKKVKTWLSDRELLNKVINMENIGLKLYKIDISDTNSGLKKWEEVIIGNSGGEKLISCLILVLALMQYTRKKVLAKYGDNENLETSKVFIIDNPFGKMSSTHLLEGLMLILNKFNVQAICLSDISQSSITNQFKVIYQLSLKSGKYSDKLYLNTDNVIKDSNVNQDFYLENAYIKADNQIRFW